MYHNVFVQHGETQFRMKTESVDVPRFIRRSYAPVVKFDTVICRRDIVPGPVSIQPIVEILLAIS